MTSRFDFVNFVGLLFIIAAIILWSQAAFAFLRVDLPSFLVYTVIGFAGSIIGGFLLKPHAAR
ncbi:MAG: hypothetical protein M1274_14920 [Actinobacteria bacterium]|nr:hypothetical protein [Actinomycetota bacterium]